MEQQEEIAFDASRPGKDGYTTPIVFTRGVAPACVEINNIDPEANMAFWDSLCPRGSYGVYLESPYDEDWQDDQYKRSFDVDHCDTESDYQLGYTSSENETIPTDDSSDEDIPHRKLKPRKLEFYDHNDTAVSPSDLTIPKGDNNILVEWVSGRIIPYMKSHNKNVKASTIKRKIFGEEEVRISYENARRARHLCLEKMHGSYEDSFRSLPELCRQIKDANPGSIVTYKKNKKTHEFEGLFIAYKACLDGFEASCCGVISLDGSPLKGKYGGAVLAATSVDGNNGMYPIAIYICLKECFETWDEFLRIIAPTLKKISEKKPLTFFSDFQKGVDTAVALNFKDVSQRVCFRHLYQEMQDISLESFRVQEYNAEYKAAKAYCEKEFEEAMAELAALSGKRKTWLDTIDPRTWARHKFDNSSCFQHITNILSQFFNQWIDDQKCLPICLWVIEYEKKLSNLFWRRQFFGKQWNVDALVPRAAGKLETLRRKYRKEDYYLLRKGVSIWLALDVNKDFSTWKVDLSKRQCCCGSWQITGVPCQHGYAVIMEAQAEKEKFVDERYSVRNYHACYAGRINEMPSITEWQRRSRCKVNPPKVTAPKRKQKKKVYDHGSEIQRPKKWFGTSATPKRRSARIAGQL